MPSTTVTVDLPVDPAKAWALVADPGKMPRWWPAVDRVDRPSESEYTRWIQSPRGRAVPMRFLLVELEPGHKTVWRQQLADTAFERSVRQSDESVEVSEFGGGSRVQITIARKLRGTAKLGSFFVSKGQRKELEGAMSGLKGVLA